jgi:hypothetical protein
LRRRRLGSIATSDAPGASFVSRSRCLGERQADSTQLRALGNSVARPSSREQPVVIAFANEHF